MEKGKRGRFMELDGCKAERADSIGILRRLIAINTVNPPGREEAAAEYLAGLLRSYGFCCEVQELGDGRANLIAWMGEDEGPELILNGHLDVVPAIGRWETDPFEAVFQDGKIYGRGTADMKGGIAAMCEAAIRVAEKGGPGRGRLKLVFVADEECSNLGTLSCMKTLRPGSCAIIGEPTELRVAIAHRGVSRDYVDLLGKARHAALPRRGENAVTMGAKAVLAIQGINKELEARNHEVLPPPGIAVTMVQGYEKDNIVPGRVRLLLDFRILPGMSHEEVCEILKAGLNRAGIEGYELVPHFYMPGGEISSGDDFVRQCMEVREQVLGERQEKPCAFDASCEQCFLAGQGVRTVICGPGSLNEAHTVGEFVREEQIRQAADFYEAVAERLLGLAGRN